MPVFICRAVGCTLRKSCGTKCTFTYSAWPRQYSPAPLHLFPGSYDDGLVYNVLKYRPNAEALPQNLLSTQVVSSGMSWGGGRTVVLRRYHVPVCHETLWQLRMCVGNEHQTVSRKSCPQYLNSCYHRRLPYQPSEVFMRGTWEASTFECRKLPHGSYATKSCSAVLYPPTADSHVNV